MMKIASFRITPVRNGFSLLEMLVVVSIILILATVAVPKFMSAGKTAKIAKISADIRTIDNAAALYERHSPYRTRWTPGRNDIIHN